MRIRVSPFLVVLGIFLFTAPVWASTLRADLPIDNTARIEGKQLKPGDYTLVATPHTNQARIMKGNKLVAEVTCTWVNLSKKANDTEILFGKKNVIEGVHFAGKTEALQFR